MNQKVIALFIPINFDKSVFEDDSWAFVGGSRSGIELWKRGELVDSKYWVSAIYIYIASREVLAARWDGSHNDLGLYRAGKPALNKGQREIHDTFHCALGLHN